MGEFGRDVGRQTDLGQHGVHALDAFGTGQIVVQP